MSPTSSKTYDYSPTSLGCERAIFIFGVTATPGDVNIIAIEKVSLTLKK